MLAAGSDHESYAVVPCAHQTKEQWRLYDAPLFIGRAVLAVLGRAYVAGDKYPD